MKGSRFYSILKDKCPVCQEGNVYVTSSSYNLKHFDKMHDNCPTCHHRYEKENGFWYGAMFVSYALTVAFSIITFLLTYIIYPSASVWLYIILIAAGVILLMPVTFRKSRMIWMSFFNHYDPTIKSKLK